MSIEHTRSQITGSIWRAIAQSGVDLSSVPQDQQAQMVDRITDNVLLSMNSALDEVAAAVPQAVQPSKAGDEAVLWEGRPFLSLSERYIITTERIKIIKGLLSRDVENFELIRIQDMDFSQAAGERMLGLGDVTIRGHDASDPTIVLRNISKPEEVYEILRKAWLEARKRHGLQFREYM